MSGRMSIRVAVPPLPMCRAAAEAAYQYETPYPLSWRRVERALVMRAVGEEWRP